MITSKDIAKIAGVSQTTVSAVLNGRSSALRISKTTEARVHKVALNLGYKPNLLARSLREGRTFTLGVLLPAPRENVYSRMIGEFEKQFSTSEYSGLFGFWNNQDEIGETTEMILRRQVDGIITVEPAYLPAGLDVPAVSIFTRTLNYDYVDIDRIACFCNSIEYLVGLGHTRIAKVDCSETTPGGIELMNGYLKILDSFGLESRWLTGIMTMTRISEISDAAEKAVSWVLAHPKNERPTAILMTNDAAAICFIGAAQRRGLRVPEDISVIGLDNISIGSWINPRLTTFDIVDTDGVAATALKTLFQRIEKKDSPYQQNIVKAEMVIRESTGQVPE